MYIIRASTHHPAHLHDHIHCQTSQFMISSYEVCPRIELAGYKVHWISY